MSKGYLRGAASGNMDQVPTRHCAAPKNRMPVSIGAIVLCFNKVASGSSQVFVCFLPLLVVLSLFLVWSGSRFANYQLARN